MSGALGYGLEPDTACQIFRPGQSMVPPHAAPCSCSLAGWELEVAPGQGASQAVVAEPQLFQRPQALGPVLGYLACSPPQGTLAKADKV